MEGESVRINVEVTTSTKASSDREYPAIKDHLEKAKQNNPSKKCYLVYVSPETHYRMVNNMRDFNILHKDDADMKMLPLSFPNFQLLMDKLIVTVAEIYPVKEILTIFEDYKLFVDDARVLEVLHDRLFADDKLLEREIVIQEQEKHQRTVDELIQDLFNLEDNLREEKGVVHLPAIRDIIFLVFIKLYEEKREFGDKENRFKPDTFKKYQEYRSQEHSKRAIHLLFGDIKKDEDLKEAVVFTDSDTLSEKIDDDFVMEFFIKKFDRYHFYTTRIDGIGAAYEVLGMRTGKDVKAGQFFTPENVVKFMVRLAKLDVQDIVLDPACGTSRFLIYAMRDMQKKSENGRDIEKTKEHIAKQQLFGSDYDLNVAKLAKMNMYINGDGKSNIFDRDGLLLYSKDNPDIRWNLDGRVDVILTNPPLGDQSFLKSEYDNHFKYERMSVIPKKNVTKEKLAEQETRLSQLNQELSNNHTADDISAMKRLQKRAQACQEKIVQLKARLASGQATWKTNGKQMKGGALFIGASALYLKDVRNQSEPIEWRGGKLVVIVDEGILNTDEYSKFREFIKMHYYIKAIISLTSDTFVPVSKTLTKTSILFLIKKTDCDAVQREPIFFAYVDKVGLNTKRKVCDNHLFADDNTTSVLDCYNRFREMVLSCYTDVSFNSVKLASLLKINELIPIKGQSHYYIRQFSNIENRFDENYNNPKYDEIDEIIKKADATILLGDKRIIKNITSGKTPKGIKYLTDDTTEGIPFLGAHQISYGSVNLNTAPKISKKFHTGILKGSIIKKGRLLITMAGAIGRCSLYEYDEESNANQAVAIIELQENIELPENKNILPEYIKYYLNSKIGQLYFQKYQHESSQPNINLEEIKRIKIITLNGRQQDTIIEESHKTEKSVLSLGKDIEAKKIFSKELIDRIIIGA